MVPSHAKSLSTQAYGRVFNDSLSVNLGMQGNMCLDTLRAQHRHDTTWQLKQTNQNLKDGCPGSLPAPQLEVSRSLLLSGSWTAGSEPQTAGRSRVPADHWRHWPLIKYTQRGTCLCMHSYWRSSGDIKYILKYIVHANVLYMQHIFNSLPNICLFNKCIFISYRTFKYWDCEIMADVLFNYWLVAFMSSAYF